jgi:hypothetical protein
LLNKYLRIGVAYFKAGTWKVRRMRKGDALGVEGKRMLYIFH